jgi:hypothetical protein
MKHPIQPLYETESGVIRFFQNKIVCDLLDFATERGFGLNEMACRDYSQDDRIQLAQLIGYSLSGFGDLSYVDDQTYSAAFAMLNYKKSELQARVDFLDEKLKTIKDALRNPVSELFGVHPDDLLDQ